MVPYFALLSIVSGSGILFFGKDKKIKQFLFFSAACTIFMQALRAATVGVDTPVYYNSFQIIRTLNWENCNIHNWEPFYLALNWGIGQLTDNFNVLLAVISVLIIGNIWWFVFKNSDNIFWSIFLFFTLDYFFMSMYSIRQYCALAIGINIFTILKEDSSKKGFLKALALLIIAMCFHTTAFVCIVLFVPFIIKKIDVKMIAVLGIAIVVSILMFSEILEMFFIIFPQYEKYRKFGSEKFQGSSIRNIDLIFTSIKILFVMIVSRFNPKIEKNQMLYKILFITGVSVALSIMVTQVTVMWRFTYYFDIFLIILIPNVVERFRKYKAIIYLIIFVFGIIYFTYIMLVNGGQCVPYKFFWQ